ncbi:MAG TPA: BMP family ABC transporter substrate-binding protein [Candidatus Copromorpha excrementigallinarum]|uniref:BMP family ABC transporter substrate-binding protein n=1 Tax=Candidatus Allocopromorpha excrementigallinarum TaxID=2840742 RepID=A0A9D1I0N4_9FIRM|nr:BMP family ABC transporter substrate-binding protein [Candidatus Copromorpha excrementigallinarum]
MKKVLVVMLAVIMAFAFTACGGDEESSDAGKVGAIYIGNINDGGFTQGMHEALEKSSEENGLELLYKENVSDSDAQAIRDAATNFIDEGCTIIVGCSYGFGETLDELANSGDYDDITFLHFSGLFQNETNMENFFGSMDEARYLSGMAAAATSESGVLGYVAAYPLPEVQIGINSFTLGAQAVDPDVEVRVIYINTWGDAELERTAAEQLISAGCDVLTYHADSTATQLAAADAGVYTTGWNYRNNAAGDYYITAPYWDMSAYFTPTFEAILDGSFKPTGNQPFSSYGSMESGMICIDDFGPAVPEDAVEQINAVKEQMENGEFSVFSGEIMYADGTVLCEEGQTLTVEEIWNINKEIEGVISTSN